MACKGFTQFLLKFINFLFTLVGLAMIGYGIYMVVIWNSSSSSSSTSPPPPPPASPPPPPPSDEVRYAYRSPPASPSPPVFDEFGFRYQSPQEPLHVKDFRSNEDINVPHLRKALLQQFPKSNLNQLSSFWSNISSAWFLYVFIAVGVVITLITCSGCIAAATANGCCLSCYSFFVGIFMILELSLAGFIFFDDDWQEVIPDDSTGQWESIESFIEDNIKIFRWVALGAIILQAFALFLAVILRALGRSAETYYDSDDDYLEQRPTSRQPLLNRQPTSTSTSTSTGSENHPVRTDAWSTRMREKYGLDTKEFSYNPSQQQPAVPEVKPSRCAIM